jgi:hypothetical protein
LADSLTAKVLFPALRALFARICAGTYFIHKPSEAALGAPVKSLNIAAKNTHACTHTRTHTKKKRTAWVTVSSRDEKGKKKNKEKKEREKKEKRTREKKEGGGGMIIKAPGKSCMKPTCMSQTGIFGRKTTPPCG